MILFIQFTYSWFKNRYLISTSKLPHSFPMAQVLQLYLWLAIPIILLSHIIGHPISSSQNCTSCLIGHIHLLLPLLTSILFIKCCLDKPFCMHMLFYIIYLLNSVLTLSINSNGIVWYCYPFFIVIYCHPVWWFYTRAIDCALFFIPEIVIVFDKKCIVIICCFIKECIRDSIDLHVISIIPLILIFLKCLRSKLTTSINNTPLFLFSNCGVYKASAWYLIILLQLWTLKLFFINFWNSI